MTAYKSYPKFYVSVDCIIFGFKDGRLKVLIHQRQIGRASCRERV